MKSRFFVGGSLFLGAMLLTASPAFAQDSGGEAPAAEAPAAGAPNDAQIAAIVVSANKVDVDAGKYAEKHTKNKEVKAFAETMVRDHTSVNKQATALVKKLKVKPEANATSKALEDEGKKSLAALKKLKGAEFDKAYVDNEVAYHQQVIDAVTNTLLPNAKNPELKGLLEKGAPIFQAHLEHAKKLQGELSGGAGETK